MYNENQKREFISSYTNSHSTAAKVEQIFSWFESYEKEWNMDLSQQSAETLQPVVNKLTGLRIKSTELVLIILKEYVKWCAKSGYETSKGVFDVKINTIQKINDQMVVSPFQLKSKLDEYFDTADKETVDITYRVFLWMAFAGMEDKDAIRVTADCVDLENLRINFEGHSYELYKQCIEDFKKACSLTDFQYIHPNYTTRKERACGDTIMRGFSSPIVDLKTIRPIINKKFDSKNIKLGSDEQKNRYSYKRIYLSGIFFRAYEREQAGLPVDFSEFIAMSIERKEKTKKYTLSETRTLSKIARTIEREYIADYEKWKCAFKL